MSTLREAEMRAATRLPVTVKHRIGVDDVDQYEDMLRFVDVVSEARCDGPCALRLDEAEALLRRARSLDEWAKEGT